MRVGAIEVTLPSISPMLRLLFKTLFGSENSCKANTISGAVLIMAGISAWFAFRNVYLTLIFVALGGGLIRWAALQIGDKLGSRIVKRFKR
jgi:hypothetical protein